MNNQKLEPWQKAPVKIVSEGINLAKKHNEEDSLIAFLLLDVAAEMLLKTYLGLPKKVTGAITSEDERFAITRKGFHDIVEGVKNSRQGISVKDLARVEFFHGVRNKLYHQGNGLTVKRDHLEEYIEVLKVLFIQLLKINLNDLLSNSKMTKEQAEYIVGIKEKIATELKDSRMIKSKLDSLCDLVIEVVSPRLLLPTYTREFAKLVDQAFSVDSFTMVGDELIPTTELPRETDKLTEIVECFKALTTPVVLNSKYYNALYKNIEAGNKHNIEALGNTLGIKNFNVERQMIPSVFSVIFDELFDLKSFYYNVVEIVIFNDVYFRSEVGSMIFEIEKLYPPYNYNYDLEYWESTLNSCKFQNQKLSMFVSRVDKWLSVEGQS